MITTAAGKGAGRSWFSRRLARFRLIHRLKRKVRMRVGGARAHFRGDPDRFHYLLLGRAILDRLLGVAANAVRTLGHMRHRDRDQLLGLGGQRAVGEHGLTELLESRGNLGGELRALARKLLLSGG